MKDKQSNNYREVVSCFDCIHCTVTMFCGQIGWARVDLGHICDRFEQRKEKDHDQNKR